MKTSPLIRSFVYGKTGRRTIYYFTGYNTTVKQFRTHIRLLQLCRFRVVAFDYQPKVLDGGNPELMVQAVEHTLTIVKSDAEDNPVAGSYGISLGTVFAYNTLRVASVNKLLLSAGGASMLSAVWDVDYVGLVRRNFEKNGYERAVVKRVWDAVDIQENSPLVDGAHVLAMISRADQTIPYDMTVRLLDTWGTADVRVLAGRFRHGVTIVLNTLHLIKTVRFFRGSVY